MTPAAPTGVRRIGLMGGSFDPVHQAHVALATEALRHLGLTEVRWIPVGQPWQKARQLAAPQHRLAMVALAIAHEPRFVLDPIEVNRPGPSYTLDTVQALQAQHRQTQAADSTAEWFLIIGQDQYANLPTWHGWQTLLQCVTLAVSCRGGLAPQAPSELAQVPPLAVSSTDIRARLSRGQGAQTLAPALVPVTVAGYIANHQLYAPPGTPC